MLMFNAAGLEDEEGAMLGSCSDENISPCAVGAGDASCPFEDKFGVTTTASLFSAGGIAKASSRNNRFTLLNPLSSGACFGDPCVHCVFVSRGAEIGAPVLENANCTIELFVCRVEEFTDAGVVGSGSGRTAAGTSKS